MHDPDMHAEDITVNDGNLRQTLEQMAVLRKGLQIQWNQFEEQFANLVNNTGIPHDDANKIMNSVRQAVAATHETEWALARRHLDLMHYVCQPDDEKDIAARASKANAQEILANAKVAKADSKEKLREVIASWDFSDKFEDIDQWDWEGKGKKNAEPSEVVDTAKKKVAELTGIPIDQIDMGEIKLRLAKGSIDPETGEVTFEEKTIEEFEAETGQKVSDLIKDANPDDTEVRQVPEGEAKPALDDLLRRLMGKDDDK